MLRKNGKYSQETIRDGTDYSRLDTATASSQKVDSVHHDFYGQGRGRTGANEGGEGPRFVL
jgi:hypothetical protein